MEEELNITPEEIQELRDKAQKTEELETKLKQLEEDEKTINWRKTRAVIDTQKKHLEAMGKKTDEDGNVIEDNKFSADDIARLTGEQVEKKFIDKSLRSAESDLNDDDQKVFRRYFEKASHGESVTSDNVDEFISLAYKMAGVSSGKTFDDRRAGTRGGAPVMNPNDRPEYTGQVAKMAEIANAGLSGGKRVEDVKLD